MDGLDILIKDHETLKQILSKILDKKDKNDLSRTEINNLLQEFKHQVQRHEKAEEDFLYPTLEKHREIHDLTLEAYEEHKLVDHLVADLEQAKITKDQMIAKITVLQENLEHHIKEEEGELFPKTRKILDQDILKEISNKIKSVFD